MRGEVVEMYDLESSRHFLKGAGRQETKWIMGALDPESTTVPEANKKILQLGEEHKNWRKGLKVNYPFSSVSSTGLSLGIQMHFNTSLQKNLRDVNVYLLIIQVTPKHKQSAFFWYL